MGFGKFVAIMPADPSRTFCPHRNDRQLHRAANGEQLIEHPKLICVDGVFGIMQDNGLGFVTARDFIGEQRRPKAIEAIGFGGWAHMVDQYEPDNWVAFCGPNDCGRCLRVIWVAADIYSVLASAVGPAACAVAQHRADNRCLAPCRYQNRNQPWPRLGRQLIHPHRWPAPIKGNLSVQPPCRPNGIDAQIVNGANQQPDRTEQQQFTLCCFDDWENPVRHNCDPSTGYDRCRTVLICSVPERHCLRRVGLYPVHIGGLCACP